MSSSSSNFNEVSTRTYIYIYTQRDTFIERRLHIFPVTMPCSYISLSTLSTTEIDQTCHARASIRFPGVAIWKIFEILGGMVI